MSRRFYSASSQYLEVASAVTVSMPFTMACWFKASTAQSQVLMSIVDTANANRGWRLNTTGTVAIAVQHDGTTVGTASTTATYATEKWFHIAGTYIAANSRAVYLNGGNVATNTTNTAVSMATCNVTDIGVRRNSTPANYYDGLLAHAAIWSVQLTPGEIKALGSGWYPDEIRPNSLLGYWPLDGLGGGVNELNRAPQGQQVPMVINASPVLRDEMPPMRFRIKRRRMVTQQAAASTIGNPYYYRHLAGVSM